MVQLAEVKLNLPIVLPGGQLSTTLQVWELLTASRDGDLARVKAIVNDCPAMAYAQYNYTPPVHFAVSEGHTSLVQYLLSLGALDPAYRTYPFGDSLVTMADDRGYTEIAALLQDYLHDPSRVKFKGDGGEHKYIRTEEQTAFEQAVDKGEIDIVKQILAAHPEYALDETFFWGEGILSMPAHDNRIDMLGLLLQYGACVPPVSKWGREYYFKHYEPAKFLLENGMDPDHITWRRVTLLHDMAQLGNIQKATLLLHHGATVDPIDEEYYSTPLGLACRWGHAEIVELLLSHGADPNKSGAPWSTPMAWAEKKGHTAIANML